MSEVEWTMRNGQSIRISDMSDSHLNNARGLAQRKFEEYVSLNAPDEAEKWIIMLAHLDCEAQERGN